MISSSAARDGRVRSVVINETMAQRMFPGVKLAFAIRQFGHLPLRRRSRDEAGQPLDPAYRRLARRQFAPANERHPSAFGSGRDEAQSIGGRGDGARQIGDDVSGFNTKQMMPAAPFAVPDIDGKDIRMTRGHL